MKRTAEDWWAAVRVAGDLPFGPARTDRPEQLVAETVDAPGYLPTDVLDAVGTAARIGLITSYVHDGAHPAALTPFTWLLTRYDAAPSWLGAARAARHPLDVPLDDRRHDRAPGGLAGADRGDAGRDVRSASPAPARAWPPC